MSYEKYYTPEQMDRLGERRESVGEDRMREVQREWAELFAAYGEAKEAGLDPTSDEVKALAQKSAALIAEFTGGDPEILQSLGDMYRGEGAERVLEGHGMEMAPGLWEYMSHASAALQGDA